MADRVQSHPVVKCDAYEQGSMHSRTIDRRTKLETLRYKSNRLRRRWSRYELLLGIHAHSKRARMRVAQNKVCNRQSRTVISLVCCTLLPMTPLSPPWLPRLPSNASLTCLSPPSLSCYSPVTVLPLIFNSTLTHSSPCSSPRPPLILLHIQ